MLRYLLALLLVLLFSLTGCSKINDKEVITFSSWGSVTEVKILKKIISEFERENPDIKIDFVHVPQNYFQKLHLLFVSNTPPDVIFINNLNIPIYAKYLTDLDFFVDEKDFYTQSINGLKYEGKLKAIPRDISNLVLYVNLNKMDLPNSNWSIEDLLKFAKTNTEEGRFGISFEKDIYWVMPYLAYFGGEFCNSDGCLMESEKSQRGLNFYLNLRDKEKVAPADFEVGSSTLAQMFLEGKISMYLSGRWMYPIISEKATFAWAVINFPYGESEQLCDVSGWAISKNAKDKDGAVKFVKYLSSPKSSEYFAQTGLVVPARIETSNLLNNPEHNERVFLEVIKKSKNTPVCKNYKKLVDETNLKYLN